MFKISEEEKDFVGETKEDIHTKRNWKDIYYTTALEYDSNTVKYLYALASNLKIYEDMSQTITITAIPDEVTKEVGNDYICVVNNTDLLLVEYRSTINPNMPYRMLEYYMKHIEYTKKENKTNTLKYIGNSL